mgnify:FL=1
MIYRASATILVNRFVKSSGVGTVATQTTSGGICLGVTTSGGRAAPIPLNTADPVEAAQSGEDVQVLEGEPGERPEVLVGSGGLSVGGEVMSDTAGKGVAATGTGKYVVGIALATAAAGELCPIKPCLYQLN